MAPKDLIGSAADAPIAVSPTANAVRPATRMARRMIGNMSPPPQVIAPGLPRVPVTKPGSRLSSTITLCFRSGQSLPAQKPTTGPEWTWARLDGTGRRLRLDTREPGRPRLLPARRVGRGVPAVAAGGGPLSTGDVRPTSLGVKGEFDERITNPQLHRTARRHARRGGGSSPGGTFDGALSSGRPSALSECHTRTRQHPLLPGDALSGPDSGSGRFRQLSAEILRQAVVRLPATPERSADQDRGLEAGLPA